jgi:hypothetical protein
VFYWRARALQGSTTGPWSATAHFKSKLVGFNRPGELYDPLIFGETVGDRIGSTEFVPGKGIRLNTNTSYVRYLLPQTVQNGEFSMEVEGLRANGPGDKAKVFGMQEGQDDYITNRYRVDIQYRGTAGFPANAITYRVLYGDDPCCKYEPDTDTRFRSVVLLDKKLDIQPGDNRYAVHLSRTLPFPADLYGVFPHMHLIGRTVRVTATLPDATVLPLIAIGDSWRIHRHACRRGRHPSSLGTTQVAFNSCAMARIQATALALARSGVRGCRVGALGIGCSHMNCK